MILYERRISIKIFFLFTDNLPDKYRLRGGIYFVDSFPETANGKVLRRKVKEDLIKLYNNKTA